VPIAHDVVFILHNGSSGTNFVDEVMQILDAFDTIFNMVPDGTGPLEMLIFMENVFPAYITRGMLSTRPFPRDVAEHPTARIRVPPLVLFSCTYKLLITPEKPVLSVINKASPAVQVRPSDAWHAGNISLSKL